MSNRAAAESIEATIRDQIVSVAGVPRLRLQSAEEIAMAIIDGLERAGFEIRRKHAD